MEMSRTKKLFIYSILITYALITIFPFLWALLASFHSRADIASGNILFTPYTVSNYIKVITDNPLFTKWIFNTLLIALVGTGLNVLFNTMAGYAISRIRFKYNNAFLALIMIVLVIPGQVLMIPNYLLITKFGLLNTYASLIIPSLVSATYIFMMSQFFISFPTEVEEAAYIDGLNRVQIFFKIAMPLAKPAIATQALFIFIGFWNSFQSALLYIQSPEKYTLQLGLQSFQSSNDSQWNLIMSGAIISVVPIVIMYLLLNKYFMEGAKFGGSK